MALSRFFSRLVVAALALFIMPALPLRGEDAGDMLDEPGVLIKVAKAIGESKIDFLTPRVSGNTSYHLRSLEYLGYVTRFGKRYYIAEAFFLRSSAKGKDSPPPRGHPALLILDAKCRIVSYGLDGDSDLRLEGTKLKSKDGTLLDFGDTDIRIRHSGWPWGGTQLGYPFEDGITDKEWDSGSFREKDKLREKTGR